MKRWRSRCRSTARGGPAPPSPVPRSPRAILRRPPGSDFSGKRFYVVAHRLCDAPFFCLQGNPEFVSDLMLAGGGSAARLAGFQNASPNGEDPLLETRQKWGAAASPWEPGCFKSAVLWFGVWGCCSRLQPRNTNNISLGEFSHAQGHVPEPQVFKDVTGCCRAVVLKLTGPAYGSLSPTGSHLGSYAFQAPPAHPHGHLAPLSGPLALVSGKLKSVRQPAFPRSQISVCHRPVLA